MIRPPGLTAAFVLSTAAVSCAFAQPAAWPDKPIRMTVASGAGGGLDFVARLVATPLTEALGKSVVVDNRAGASGSIAADITAHSPPDGYTVMMLSASLVVYGVVNKTPYDLFRDFDAVTQVAASPYLLGVYPGLPVKTVADFVAYAKANPSKLNFASTGNASLAHLAGELFAQTTGTKMVHVPYKGVGAAMTDLLSGQVQLCFLSGGSIYNQVRSGKLRALAVASAVRVKNAPELPTMIEAGVPGFAVTQWHGLLAPHGTPKVIIDRLHKEIAKAVQNPDIAARLAQDGTEGVGSTPQQFAAFLKSERDQWARVVKSANIRAD
jgi:tripartite-type tricarboxylate transporter receptor subunit TctC